MTRDYSPTPEQPFVFKIHGDIEKQLTHWW